MSKQKTAILILVSAISVLYVGTWLVHRSSWATQDFVHQVASANYGEATEILTSPCSMSVNSDGGLVLVDRRGNSTVVPAGKLPFVSGGGQQDGPGDFAMTALGPSTNGKLNTPAITIYFSVDGQRICIERVDP